jgi:hypothetical protein
MLVPQVQQAVMLELSVVQRLTIQNGTYFLECLGPKPLYVFGFLEFWVH